ncbi:MAG: hypothetical protein JRE40_01190 [Deltaproteobacteria bacterium]|nr:hypothetical protein [Deltaproteobacteria bacterium]
MEKDLTTKRQELHEAVFNSYSPDDFPGSKNWQITFSAQNELNEFDKAHPEIVAKIKAAKAAKDAATAKKAGWI